MSQTTRDARRLGSISSLLPSNTLPVVYYIDYNLKYIKYLLTQRKNKKQTYGPNDMRHVSFGLYLIVIAIQYLPSCVLRRLKLVVV